MNLRRSFFTRKTPLLALVAALVVFTAIFHHLSQMHLMKERALESAEKQSEKLALVIDQSVYRSLQSISIVIHNIARSVETDASTPDLKSKLEQRPHVPELRGILYVRPDFSIAANSFEESEAGDYLSSPEFLEIAYHLSRQGQLVLPTSDPDGLVVGRVISGGAPNGQQNASAPFLPVSFTVRSSDGSLLGFLVALLNVPYLEYQFRTLASPFGGNVFVADYEGRLLATTSSHMAAGDNWFRGNPIFTSYAPDLERSTFRSDIDSNNEMDIVSFRVTPTWPIIVAVSLPDSVALASWRDDLAPSALRQIMYTLILLAGLLFLGRYLSVSELKESEMARQRGMLQGTLDNMSDGLIDFSKDGKVAFANARLASLLMSDSGSLTTMHKFMVPMRKVLASESKKDAALAYRSLANVLRGRVKAAELLLRSGRLLEVRSSAKPDCGRILLVDDVTTRRAQEDAARRFESEKNSIVLSALDCIVIADSDGVVREFNPAAERTFGWTRDEIIGLELADTIVPERMREGHRRGMERFLQQGGGNVIGRRIEIVALRRNGEEFPCELAITSFQDRHETYFTAYLRDISERTRVWQELTAAREAAEDASRAKSQFLAQISHEIRTPMNAIVGYSGLALESDDPRELRQYSEGISDAARSLLTLVNDLLDLARLEAGRMRIVEERFNLHQLVSQVADTARVLTRDKEILVRLDCDVPVKARFMGDRDRIRQILLNLVGNAAKFTERGSIAIGVRSAICSADGDLLEIAVTDTGVGISEEAMLRLFRPFEQDEAHDRTRIAGTGLGLGIARSLARAMGGDISFESILGRGSTFTCFLRLRRVPEADKDPAVAVRKVLAEAGVLKILVAEDTPASQVIIRKLLERRGFSVVIASDGEEAVRLAGAEKPDAIFMDVQMPKMDGVTATRHIRGLPGPVSSVPIIALTAQAFSSDREHCRAVGMDDFLAKPILPELLDDVLARALNVSLSDVSRVGGEAPEVDAMPVEAGGGAAFNASILRIMIEDIGADTTARILERCAVDAQSLSAKLENGFASGDEKVVRAAAHALVGLLRQIGLTAAVSIANALEREPENSSLLCVGRLRDLIGQGLSEARAFVRDPRPTAG